MKNRELSSIFENQAKKLYSLAFVISGKDLPAKQLLIDAYTRLVIKHKQFFLEAQVKELEERNSFVAFFHASFVKELLVLGKNQERMQKVTGEYESFFNLSLEERLVLFLRTQWKMRPSDIGELLGISPGEVAKNSFIAKEGLL